MNGKNEVYDVFISGAGPAGTACALALRESGLRVALADKSSFPRDKVCGDAIGGRIPGALREISPNYEEQFLQFARKSDIYGCRLFSPNLNFIDVTFSKQGYTSTRTDFDNFLYQLAVEESGADILTDTRISGFTFDTSGVNVKTDKGEIRAKIAIGADGAHSILARKHAGIEKDPDHHCGAVRAYYQGIEDLDPNSLEVYFPKGYLPGYFWVFPLPEGRANVGYGMLSRTISEQRINLKTTLTDIIESIPSLKPRFKHAQLEGPITGFGLPLGSKKRPLSGERFMLTGDAAGLIDPFTGEGIGNALISATLAARRAMLALEKDDFSADFMQVYDQQVYDRLWKTFKTSHLFQRLLGSRTWLIDFLLGTATKNKFFRNWLHKAM